LKTFWSLAAKAGLGALLALELLLIGFLGRSNEWLWMLLLSLPLLGWLVAQQERSLQSLIAVFLDDLAQAHGMIKVKMPEDGKSSIPKPVADRPVRRPQRDPDRPSPAPKSANGPLRVVLPKTTPAKVPNSPPSNDQGAAP
jgi:hypothetical protein